MKGSSRRQNISMMLLFVLLSIGQAAADPPAGPYPPGMPGNGHGAWGDQQGAPIDGGLAFLLAMGTVYAISKSRSRKRNDTGNHG